MQSKQTTSATKTRLVDAALELVWPTRCAGCERPGELLCDTCRDSLSLTEQDAACPHCGAPYGFLICTECYDRTGKQEFSFALAISALTLDEISGRLIVLYKDNNEHRLASILAELIISALPLSWLTWADTLTWIPADRKALRRRGFDHMQRIALEVANLTQLSATSLLNKQVCRDQRGLNRAQRKENLKKSFSLKAQAGSLPAHILLLDDVFTTGSTLDAAAALLSESGAAEVRAVSIARAW